jgi:hypothetical protein
MLLSPCSLGLSATSQQYFSLRTNQPPATSQQYFSLRTNQHQPSATSQTNRLFVSQCSFLPFPFSFALSWILLTTAIVPCDALSVVWPQKEKTKNH